MYRIKADYMYDSGDRIQYDFKTSAEFHQVQNEINIKLMQEDPLPQGEICRATVRYIPLLGGMK